MRVPAPVFNTAQKQCRAIPKSCGARVVIRVNGIGPIRGSQNSRFFLEAMEQRLVAIGHHNTKGACLESSMAKTVARAGSLHSFTVRT